MNLNYLGHNFIEYKKGEVAVSAYICNNCKIIAIKWGNIVKISKLNNPDKNMPHIELTLTCNEVIIKQIIE